MTASRFVASAERQASPESLAEYATTGGGAGEEADWRSARARRLANTRRRATLRPRAQASDAGLVHHCSSHLRSLRAAAQAQGGARVPCHRSSPPRNPRSVAALGRQYAAAIAMNRRPGREGRGWRRRRDSNPHVAFALLASPGRERMKSRVRLAKDAGWRRRRDSNPRSPFGACSFSKRVPSASRPRLHTRRRAAVRARVICPRGARLASAQCTRNGLFGASFQRLRVIAAVMRRAAFPSAVRAKENPGAFGAGVESVSDLREIRRRGTCGYGRG